MPRPRRRPIELTGRARRRVLWISGAVALALFVVLGLLEEELTRGGSRGIVPFEVAGTTDRAREFLDEWGPGRRDTVRASLLVDYPYLIAYSVFLSLVCAAVADMNSRRPGFAGAGTIAAWAAIAAGVFDALENAALLLVLEGGPEQPWPALAAAFAVLKFACAIGATLYALTGLALRAGDRVRAGRA
jgi:hypothetical protein